MAARVTRPSRYILEGTIGSDVDASAYTPQCCLFMGGFVGEIFYAIFVGEFCGYLGNQILFILIAFCLHYDYLFRLLKV